MLQKKAKKMIFENWAKTLIQLVRKITIQKQNKYCFLFGGMYLISYIRGMKEKVDSAPETIGFGEKLLSYFTPIFTLMPSAEITSFMILPDGNGGYYIIIIFTPCVYNER